MTKTVFETNDSDETDERNCTFIISSKNNQELVDGRGKANVGTMKIQLITELDVVAGTSGKRKKFLKREDRLQRDKGKHPLLPTCDCKKKCIIKVDEDQRQNIHERFWNLDFNQRLVFLGSRLQPQLIKRRKKDSKRERQRKESYLFID